MLQAWGKTDTDRGESHPLQNLVQAQSELQAIGVDMTAAITTDACEQALMQFQKRHLIAHKLGVADQEYVDRSSD